MKENSIIQFIKSSGVFFIGNTLSKVLVYFMLPLYTTYIPTADYGIYDVSITYVTLAVYVLYFEVWTPIMRFMYDEEDTYGKSRSITNGCLLFSISSVLFFVFASAIFSQINMPYYPLVILYGIAYCLSYLVSFIARGLEKNVEFAVSGIINTFVLVTTNLVLILAMKMDYSALYIAYAAGSLAQVIYLEIRVGCIRRCQVCLVNKYMLKEMILFALPLGFNSVMYWGYTSYSRIVINSVMTASDNGIYGIATKFSVILSLVTSAATYAWQQMSYAHENDKECDTNYYTSASNCFIMALGIGTALLLPVVRIMFPVIVNDSYSAALNIVPLTLFSAAISSYSGLIGGIFGAIKDTKPFFVSSVVACLANVWICPVFVRRFGLTGAALAGAISYLFTAAMRVLLLKKRIGVRINWGILLFVGVFLASSGLMFNHFGLLGNFMWLVTVAVALVVVVYIKREKIKQWLCM